VVKLLINVGSGFCRSHEIEIADIASDRLGRARSRQHRMPVRINQTWHQHAAATVPQFGATGWYRGCQIFPILMSWMRTLLATATTSLFPSNIQTF
jgi:hypothetical protein